MIFHVMKLQISRTRIAVPKRSRCALAVVCAALAAHADKKPQLVKPMAGPRATALRVTWLYISPDMSAQKVDRVQIGREMVVAEKSGPWMRVYANTDIEEEHPSDAPHVRQQRHAAAHLRLDGGQGRGGRNDPQRRPGADGRGGQPGSAGL